MALWNEKPAPVPAARKEPLAPGAAGAPGQPLAPPTDRNPPDAMAAAQRRPMPREQGGESVIAANLSIEGKIEGSGNVRMAGRFKGDVRIDGNFTMDPGAHLTGQVLASIVVVGGELQGNIESAKRVDVLESGVIVGDVKAGSITVAAGSRMRGHVEFGWEEEKTRKIAGNGSGSGGTGTSS